MQYTMISAFMATPVTTNKMRGGQEVEEWGQTPPVLMGPTSEYNWNLTKQFVC